MIGTRTSNKRLVAVVVAAVVSVVLGSLPIASAQAQATEQFVCNDRLSMQVTASGQLNFGAFPNPSPDCRAGASSYPLSFTWPGSPTSYTTVRIDGEFHRFEFGTQTTPPTVVNGDSIFTVANFGEVEVAQLVQLAPNPATSGQPDAARISYTVRNVSPSQIPHNVGIRLFIDTRVGVASGSDNPTFFVNGQAVTTETDYIGNIPDLFSLQNPTVPQEAAAGSLGANFGNVTPNRFIIGQFGKFASSPWDYTPNQEQIFDSAFGAYWETQQLAPGGEATYSMTYGLGVGSQGGGGEPIPGCEGTEQRQCGTTGDDDISSSDGQVIGGPGDDNITLTVDETTQSLTVNAGTGADQIFLHIQDVSSKVPVTLNSGGGGDKIFVPESPGALEPVIKTGGGNDVMKILTFSGSSPKIAASFQATFTGFYTVNAGGGKDRVTLGMSDDDIDGAGGDDKLIAGGGADAVEGGAGDDDMSGGAGGDVLHGGGGVNDFAGGAGKDTCLSDTRRDVFSGCERIRRNHRRNHQQI